MIETERLTLRPFTADDVEAFHAIWGDPEVIWWGANESLEKTREGFTALLARHAEWPDETGWYAVQRRGEDDVLGDVMLQPAKFVDGIEIGWHFRKDAWGHGYATEAARALLPRGLAAHGRIYAIVATTNDRSLRIVEKLGMETVRDMEYAGLPHRLFVAVRGEA